MAEGPALVAVDNLLHMVDNPEFSDVILVCRDGIEVHACRVLLAARSLLFKQLLLDGITEGFEPMKTLGLPDVSCSVMVVILKFLYADVLCDDDILHSQRFSCKNGVTISYKGRFFFRLDWEFLLEVLSAARFFRIERLEKIIIECLCNDVPKLDSDNELEFLELSAVARSLSTLCEYDTLWNSNQVKYSDGAGIVCSGSTYEKSMEVICFLLMQILMFYELRATTLIHLSQKAFQFYLKVSKGRMISSASGETWDWDIEQYVRLREILIWCAVRASQREADVKDLDLICLPEPHTLLQDCHDQQFSSLAISRDRREIFTNRIVKDDVNQFLSMVDLVSVHPDLLVNIIEPLCLIEHEYLSRIYSFQATRVSERVRKHRHLWKWAGSGLYSLTTPFSDNTTFSVSVESSSEENLCLVAVADLEMHFRRMYEWEIVVTPQGLLELDDMSVLEIGFYRLRPGESLVGQMAKNSPSCLSDDRRGSVLRIRCSEDFYDKGAYKRSSGVLHGWPRTLWDRPLKVILDREAGICSFSSSGRGGHESAFRVQNAEGEIFYPAVYVQANDSTCMSDYDTIPGSTLRPHYDRLTVKIQSLKGFGEPAEKQYSVE